MQLSLRLESAEVGVDAMQLVIPMKTAETWLMHPVTDLLRHHYAGIIPNGQGTLLAQSTGFQSGCIGVIHDLLRGPERDRFIRSGLGVALTHELKFPLYWEPPGETIAEHLSNFGHGLPDCRVFRYWDQPSPVKTSGAAAKTLALSRGGEALIVVASYGPFGDVVLSLDPARLGLSGELSAVDLETGLAIEQSGPGQFRLKLGRHDLCLVRVSSAGR